MFKLARFLKPYKADIIIGGILKWTEALFELIVPLLMSRIVDIGIPDKDKSYVLTMGGIMLALGIAGFIFAMISQTLATRSAQKVGQSLRSEMFIKINALSYADLDKFGASTLVNRVINDSQQLSWVVALMVRLVVRAPFLILGATALAMIINLKISLIFIGAALIAGVIYYFLMSKTSKYYKKTQKQLDKLTLETRENLSGTRVVRAFSREEEEISSFKEQANSYRDVSIKAANLSSILNPLTYALFNLATAAVLWFGGKQVNAGGLTQGEIIALVNYLIQISSALVIVANIVVAFTRASASAQRVNELFDLQPSVQKTEGANASEASDETDSEHENANEYALEFENVSFIYEGNAKPSLSNISFKLKKGQTAGIIGVTGSGKSTLINLIPRFYDATEGQIRVFGKDVKLWRSDSLEKTVAVAEQKATLFSGTIRENILWGDKNASDDELIKALETACAKEFVFKKPDKLDAKVERGGQNFSGGQKQRLNIARAVLKKPRILILDDSFSALDFQTDARVRRAVKRDLPDTAKIIVSQRVSSVRNADLILVLDNGALAGAGTHDELYAALPLYKSIVDMQTDGGKK